MTKVFTAFVAAIMALALPAAAQDAERQSGPVFTHFGSWTAVDNDQPAPADQVYKVIFDVTRAAEDGERNARFDSAARFINLLVENGVPRENIEVAIIVHGPANWDITTREAYARRFPDRTHGSADMVEEMLAAGVRFYICGQSANASGISNADLIDGAVMTLSQTVATAILHNEGFTNIP